MNTARKIGDEEGVYCPWSERFSAKRRLVDDPAIRQILNVATKKGILSFAGGFPDPSLLPISQMTTIASAIMRESGLGMAQYGVSDGVHRLREELAHVAAGDGRACVASNIAITTGGQQAIDLIAQALLNYGDSVAVTRPCYLGALQIFNAFHPRYEEVSCDSEGPILDQLERALRRCPRFFYVVSSFDNPTGVSISRSRAEAIVRMCRRYDVPIVEDGAYKELYHDERRISLREIEGNLLRDLGETYDQSGRVIFVGTLSKVMAPGVRIGWVEAPREVVEGIVCVKQATDLHTANFTQMIAADFLRFHAQELWPILRADYKTRCYAARDAVEKHLGSCVRSCTQPSGGFYLWVELDPEVDTQALLPVAVETHGVAYVPSTPFFATNPQRNAMRLCYSNLSLEKIDEGISRIAKALGA
jgi:2-aminoadipate transaminase